MTNNTYDTIKFMGEGMVFTYTWPASDLELIEQSIDDYLEEDQFVAYYMTFSGHGPYTANNGMYRKNINEVLSIVGNDAYQNPRTIRTFRPLGSFLVTEPMILHMMLLDTSHVIMNLSLLWSIS